MYSGESAILSKSFQFMKTGDTRVLSIQASIGIKRGWNRNR
jgi:hypothetical protein